MLIDVPAEFQGLCKEWHDGQTSCFYGVASTGKIPLDRMNDLYEEIYPLHAKDEGLISDYILMRRFQAWVSVHLTDEWWENHDSN